MKKIPTSHISTYAIVLYVLLLMLCLVLFSAPLPLLWIAFGSVAVVGFFHFNHRFGIRFLRWPEKVFLKKIFSIALIIRIIYVVFVYYFYQYHTGEPFEFGAADAKGYHGEAMWMTDLIKDGRFYAYWDYLGGGFSDAGWPLFLFVINLIFGETLLIPRLLNALIGAGMVVLIYRLTKRNFDEPTAKTAAIITAMYPAFIYYSGLHLKETLMIFLIIAFLNQADILLRMRKVQTKYLIYVLLLGASLFFFRTVLGVAAFFSLFMAIILSHKRIISSSRKIAFVIITSVAGVLLMNTYFRNEISFYYGEQESNLERHMYSIQLKGNELAKYGRTAIFFPLVVVAPLPTFVDTQQYNVMMLNGSMFVKNILAFFLVYGLYYLWKNKRLKLHVLLLTFLFTYLFILGSSGFALSERFHLPALPLIIIFVAYGFVQLRPNYKKYYIPYLIFIGILIVGWNWFKLAGRGII